jgi:L-threonylcarbamoyladenylate synthase
VVIRCRAIIQMTLPDVQVSPKKILAAARALQQGELVAMPTETVYGLAADATNEAAIKKIFAAKGRPVDHPLIVHVAEGDDLSRWVKDLPADAKKLMAHFWPGPLTFILKKSTAIPDAVTGGQDTVGLRCPAHPVALALLREFARRGSGIVAAPSANKFGHVSPTTAQHVRDEFGTAVGTHIHLLDGGACDVGIESTIIDFSRGAPVLLRPGAISAGAIAEVIGAHPTAREVANTIDKNTPRVSGDMAAHYAPRTPLRLLSEAEIFAEADRQLVAGKRIAVLAFAAKPTVKPSPVGVGVRNARPLVWIQAPTVAADYARDLYANLRTLDAAGTSAILVEAPPTTAAWDAVNDRLKRAAVGSNQ